MSLISSFFTGTYNVTRKKTGSYQYGKYVPGEEETILIRGSLQPTNARELKIQEEGVRLKAYFNFYTDEPLFVIDTETLADSDKVLINGESYKVMSVESWKNVDLPYYLSVLVREAEQ